MSSPAATDYATANRERKTDQMVLNILEALVNTVANHWTQEQWMESVPPQSGRPSDASKQLVVAKLRTLLEIQRVLGRQA